MTSAFLWFALALGAGSHRADPASLMPGGTTVFLEVSDLSALSGALQAAPVLDRLGLQKPERLREMLGQLASAGVATGAMGLDPSALGVRRWVLLAEAADPAATAGLIATWTTGEIATATIGRFVVIADSQARVAEIRELSKSNGESLAQQPSFREFRATVDPAAPVRFFCDVKQAWPRPFRSQIRNPSHFGWAFLGAHFTHVLKTVGTVSGTLSLTGGLEAWLSADIRETDARAFTEVNPTQQVIATPDGFAARLSVSRNLNRFWARRTAILDESTRSALDALAGTITSALPGYSIETVLGQFGDAFDLYFSGSQTAAAGYPAVALVAVTAGEVQQCQLLAEFQRLLVALSTRGDVSPVFRDESVCHRGITLHVVRAEGRCASLGTGVEPTFAVVKDRVILGNRRASVAAIVDQLLDGRLVPRLDGDELQLDGVRAARLLRDASAAWTADLAKTPGAESRTSALFTALEGLLSGVQTARLGFDVAGKEASLRVTIDAPALFPAPRPASRPQ